MKVRRRPYGLFVLERRTYETADEIAEFMRGLSGRIEAYIAEAEHVAREILARAGINPDALYDYVEARQDGALSLEQVMALPKVTRTLEEALAVAKDGRPYRAGVRYTMIDRAALPAEIDEALHIVLDVPTMRAYLADAKTYAAVKDAIVFATRVEHFNANLAWEKPVRTGAKIRNAAANGNRQRGAATQKLAAEVWQPRCNELAAKNPRMTWTAIAQKVAAENGVNRSTIQRHCANPKK
ncbi:MAG TPA: hypothetical protein VF329_13510 [Gammaproteobacteria bacterium]